MFRKWRRLRHISKYSTYCVIINRRLNNDKRIPSCLDAKFPRRGDRERDGMYSSDRKQNFNNSKKIIATTTTRTTPTNTAVKTDDRGMQFVLLHYYWTKADSQLSERLRTALSSARQWPKKNFNFLLFLLTCYIVAGRIGPFVSRAGDFAIQTFEVERLIVEEFDREALELFRGVFSKFRVVTRSPSPSLLFGRASQETSTQLETAMGSRCCKPSAASKYQTHEDNGSSPPHGDEEPQEPATKKDVAPLYEKSTSPASSSSTEPLVAKAKDATEAGKPEQEEREGEEVGGEEGECRERESSVSPLSPSEPLPLKRVKDQDRKDSMFSFNVGSTESLVGLFGQDRLNPADFKNKPIKFKKIQPTIQTGDLALLYRREHPVPHVAIFVNHVETDPLFPLLLVKGKTKPLPREKFHPDKPRFIHPITATTRIFYGDYERVAVRYIQTTEAIDVEKAMDAITAVEAIHFSKKEQSAIEAAETDYQRSLLMSTFMAAYYYKELGIFDGTPDEVTPENFVEQLPLSDPLYVKLPTVKLGPMAHGDPPFLKQLVDGIYTPPDVTTLPYEEAIRGLDTGDVVLFSGATSQGAIIKFFDHSQFSHVAMVLKAQYTSQLLVWEASTNHAKLVDVQAGAVRTGVEVLPLRNKVFSGWYDRVAVRRLQNITSEQRRNIYETMLRLRKEWMGRSYEKNLVQMALSAINPSDTFLSLFQNREEDLSSLFCSELVAAAYQRMNLVTTARPSNGYTPDDFSSARDSEILCKGVELSEEVYIELKWPSSAFKTQHSVY